MKKPAGDPSFATDPLLTGGPQVGLATRLDPGAGFRAQGYYQDRRLPARHLSSLLGVLGDWANYLKQIEIKNWKREATTFFTGTTNKFGICWIPGGASRPGSGAWLLFASDTTPTCQGKLWPSAALSGPNALTTQPVLTQWFCSCANTSGTVLLAGGNHPAGADTLVYRSTTRGAGWAASTLLVGSNFDVADIAFEPVAGKFVAVLDNTGGPRTSYSTDGNTWTAGAAPTGAGGGEFAKRIVSGGGKVVMVTSAGQVAVSSDAGATWSALSLPTVAALDVAYSSTFGWLVIGQDSSLMKTADFVTYTRTAPFLSGNAMGIDSDGVSRFAVAHGDAATSGIPGAGIMFSDDGGATWELVPFDVSGNTLFQPAVIRYNGSSQWAALGAPFGGGGTGYAFFTSLRT